MASTRERIAQAVAEQRDESIERLRALVRIPSQTPPGEHYAELVELLLAELASIGFEARRVDIPPAVFEQRSRVHYPELVGPRANLLARQRLPGKPAMLWYTHLDTVPLGNLGQWRHPPLEGVLQDGRIWGRGAVDSKAGVVAIVQAFRTLHNLGIEPAVSPVIALTTDEEVGPYTGLMYLADQGEFADCQWFHCCDSMAGSVGIANAGAFTWTVAIRGTSVHSGRSQLGTNPIEHSLALLQELLALKERVQTRCSVIPNHPDVVRAGGGQTLRSLLNVTMAHGGFKHNMVPGEYVVEGDRRFTPEEAEAEAIAELREAVERAKLRDPLLDAELRIRPFYTSQAMPL
ncbi:MAG: M20/M25/M40 family metallo-hydrolase, partial [Chloroflexi bacterium]|nr:M20/M25/M40 family metallo-hydrolase [Chloroflexota bacterium]